MFERPINFRWIIIIALILFSTAPVVLFQLIQVVTLPAELEDRTVEQNKREVQIALDRISQKITSDKQSTTILSSNPEVHELAAMWKMTPAQRNMTAIAEQTTVVQDTFVEFHDSLQNFASNDDTHLVVEMGLDIIYNLAGSDLHQLPNPFDNVFRAVTVTYSSGTDPSYVGSNETYTVSPPQYYPYANLRIYPGKVHYTSSIINDFETKTNEEVTGEIKPIIFHSHHLFTDQDNPLAILWVKFSAQPVIDQMVALDDENVPVILVDQNGVILYHTDLSRIFSEVESGDRFAIQRYTGYTETMVASSGFEDEITIYRQMVVDSNAGKNILIFKILPRSYIYRTLFESVVQSIVVLVIFVSLATFSAFYITNVLTGRMVAITEAADQISKGNFDVTIDTRGTDELANLARSFDRMSKSLIYVMQADDEEF